MRVCVCRNELGGSTIDFLCVKCWGCFLEGAGITWRRSLKLRALAQLLKLTPPPLNTPVCSPHPRGAGNSQPAHTRARGSRTLSSFQRYIGYGGVMVWRYTGGWELYNIDESLL